MAKRTLNRLTARQVDSLGSGRHADGGGLYLRVEDDGARRWALRWTAAGRVREMGLGAAGKGGVDVKGAREAARRARELIAEGGDPIAAKRAPAEAPAPAKRTFGEAADAFIAAQTPRWRNAKHRYQWKATLDDYAAVLRPRAVDAIDTAAVLEVLRPIWLVKPETASRLRGRIERVLDAAKAEGHRAGENPARWRGHLDHLLAPRARLTRGHHPALPFGEVADFMVTLRARQAVAALALEFTILTAARTGEVIGATWAEIDLQGAVWTVPAERMKAGKEHRVPLSKAAAAVLEEAAKLRPNLTPGAPIFPARHGGRLSNMAMAMLLKRMKVDVTVHGFRSTFRDWAGELSNFPREVVEAALAHTVGDATERAYRRGDALEKRRRLMEAWAGYVGRERSGQVVPLRRGHG